MDPSYWDKQEGVGSLKAGMLGFAKSGKTYTGALMAIAAREALGLTGPISMFDTEGGSEYVRHIVERMVPDLPFLVKRARSFDAMLQWAAACEESGVAVGIVDSITHPWTELCNSYLEQKNKALEAAGRKRVKRLSFADWNVIKPTWATWTSFYLNSKLSIVVCGRAGWEWDFEENEEGELELRKTGVKMKTENEFGFEPSLLIEMERMQDLSGSVPRIYRRATVLGDRFGDLDGKSFIFEKHATPEDDYDAVKAAFWPHFARLNPAAHTSVDTTSQTDLKVDETGDTEWAREKKERTILAEEIQAEIVQAYPGQSAAEKKAKGELLKIAFNTGSWTKVEGLRAVELRAGLAAIRNELADRKAAEATEAANA